PSTPPAATDIRPATAQIFGRTRAARVLLQLKRPSGRASVLASRARLPQLPSALRNAHAAPHCLYLPPSYAERRRRPQPSGQIVIDVLPALYRTKKRNTL